MSLSRTIAEHLETSNATLADLESVLAKYKLLSLLPQIKQHLTRKQAMSKHRDTLMIESPFPLNDASVEMIKKIAGATNKDHTITINEELLAGFKAKHNNTLYDASAQRIINHFVTK